MALNASQVQQDAYNQMEQSRKDFNDAANAKELAGHNGIASREGRKYLSAVKNCMASIILFEWSCESTLLGIDPGGDNYIGTVTTLAQTQHEKRNARCAGFLISLFTVGSGMQTKLKSAAFSGSGRKIWIFLNGKNVLYIEPTPVEVRAAEKLFKEICYDKLPNRSKDRNAILTLASKLDNSNPYEDDELKKTEAQLCEQLALGAPSQLRTEALKCVNNKKYASANDLLYNVMYQDFEPEFNHGANPAPGANGHIANFNVNPLGDTLSFNQLTLHLSNEFQTMVESGVIRLNANPEVMIVQSPPGASVALAASIHDADIPDYLSHNDSMMSGFNLSESFAYYSGFTGDKPFVTCRNCMGIGHFAESKDRKEWLCPTPKGSVPWEILSNVRFPIGVSAWRFGKSKGGKGAGKSKGFSKGKGRGGRGRGRGYGSAYEIESVDNMAEDVVDLQIEDDTDGWD